jgi:hypothetical protein
VQVNDLSIACCWRQADQGEESVEESVQKRVGGNFDHAKKKFKKSGMHMYAAMHACALLPLFRTCCTGITEKRHAEVI